MGRFAVPADANRPIDEIDLALLHALQADARAPVATLSKAAGVSRATAYGRLTKMREDGVIKGLTVAVDPKLVGLPVTAIVMIRTMPDPSRKPDPARKWSRLPLLEKMPEVEFVADLAGDFDILVLLRLRDNDHLSTWVSEDIRRVPGIATTRTLLVLNEAPRVSLVLPPLE